MPSILVPDMMPRTFIPGGDDQHKGTRNHQDGSTKRQPPSAKETPNTKQQTPTNLQPSKKLQAPKTRQDLQMSREGCKGGEGAHGFDGVNFLQRIGGFAPLYYGQEKRRGAFPGTWVQHRLVA